MFLNDSDPNVKTACAKYRGASKREFYELALRVLALGEGKLKVRAVQRVQLRSGSAKATPIFAVLAEKVGHFFFEAIIHEFDAAESAAIFAQRAYWSVVKKLDGGKA